jgi:chromosome partitioning protein
MVTAVLAQKGGVGKTTTAITLSSYLARKGYKVLLIDIDAQGNSSQVLLHNYEDLNKEDTVASILLDRDALVFHPATRVPNLSICPSHHELSTAESLLVTLPAREKRLKMQLDAIKSQFDFVFIDCPPNVNELPKNAIVAADYLLIPFKADTFNLKGLKLLLKEKDQMIKYNDASVKVMGLLNVEYDHRTILSKTVYEKLVEIYGRFEEKGWVFNIKLPVNNAITYAHGNNRDIYEYEPNSAIATAYKNLTENELLPYLLANKDAK